MKRMRIGIDEVGRGALAGPVVLAAVLASGRMRWTHPKLGRIRDCKKLTPRRREEWFSHLAGHPRLKWRIARVSPAVIDRINIARAANLGALRAYRRVRSSTNSESVTNKRIRRPSIRKFAKDSLFGDGRVRILLDGGLKLPASIPHHAIVKGDERVPLIAASSIIAKVWRDRFMTRLASVFPAYGFEVHKGYGTKFHRRQLRRFGPSEMHRRTFLSRLNSKIKYQNAK